MTPDLAGVRTWADAVTIAPDAEAFADALAAHAGARAQPYRELRRWALAQTARTVDEPLWERMAELGIDVRVTRYAPPVPQDVSKSFPRDIYIRSPRLSGLLLEGVKNVDRLVEPRHIDHPMFSVRVDPYLPNPGSHGRYRLPVRGIEALLDCVELVACSPPGVLRKRPHISSGRLTQLTAFSTLPGAIQTLV